MLQFMPDQLIVSESYIFEISSIDINIVLKTPRKVNGYGADYAPLVIREILYESYFPSEYTFQLT